MSGYVSIHEDLSWDVMLGHQSSHIVRCLDLGKLCEYLYRPSATYPFVQSSSLTFMSPMPGIHRTRAEEVALGMTLLGLILSSVYSLNTSWVVYFSLSSYIQALWRYFNANLQVLSSVPLRLAHFEVSCEFFLKLTSVHILHIR